MTVQGLLQCRNGGHDALSRARAVAGVFAQRETVLALGVELYRTGLQLGGDLDLVACAPTEHPDELAVGNQPRAVRVELVEQLVHFGARRAVAEGRNSCAELALRDGAVAIDVPFTEEVAHARRVLREGLAQESLHRLLTDGLCLRRRLVGGASLARCLRRRIVRQPSLLRGDPESAPLLDDGLVSLDILASAPPVKPD